MKNKTITSILCCICLSAQVLIIPYAYIQAHQAEYDEIVALGDAALLLERRVGVARRTRAGPSEARATGWV